MPAYSEKQRRAMNYALAVQQGKAKTKSGTIRKLAGSLSEEQLSDFATRVETQDERRRRVTARIARERARGK